MDTLECIFTRRSIRKFLPKEVKRETIDDLLHAAMAAPSAGNSQSWLFLVITDKVRLAQIPSIHPYSNMCPESAATILVCGNTTVEKYPGFWPQDCSAAVQNLLLAARARDIGTVWCGIHPLEERMQAFRKMFELPAEASPFALVALGYTDQPFVRRERYDAAKVHWEKW